ncbi:MAG: signal peptidase I [Anaerolineales bacterium]
MLEQTPPPAPRWRRVAWDIVQTVTQAVLLYVLIATVFGRFEIQQISMEPNFHEGQRVLVFQLGSTLSSLWADTAHAAGESLPAPFAPQRGQIVILYPSTERTETVRPLIKRVIGVPGDMIEISEGVVRVNGAMIAEPYVQGRLTNCFGECGPLILGAEAYYVMGDNRPNSRDSRTFGPITGGQIVGRVVARYWPLTEFELYP